ncbi:hypothetical protein ACHAQH_004619 [Verticillium albo-atrum]
MRTRRSNRSKRYSEAIDYGLDDDDVNETPARNSPRHASDDDNFVVDAGAAQAEDDDFIAPDESDANIKDESFLVLDSDDDENGTSNAQRKKRSYHSRRKLPPGHDATAMDPYPQESRFTQTRMHHGIFSSWIRTAFWDDFYGPDPHAASQAADMFRKWAPYEVLPCKLLDEEWALQPTPWVRDDFEVLEAAIARDWYERIRKEHQGQVQRSIDELEATPYLSSIGEKLKILGGPYPDQQQMSLDLNGSVTISSDGLPYSSDAMDTDDGVDKPAGWMFDVGGLVLGMSWLPRASATSQILALAVSPFTDQDFDWQHEQEYVNDEMERGRIQLWEFEGEQAGNGVKYPSREAPQLLQTLCFDWGRAKTIHWCPVPSTVEGHLGLLAVLCNDRQVHILDLQKPGDEPSPYSKIDKSMATIGALPGLPASVTIFAWSGTNRVVTAHTDGSIGLWSLHPPKCISRHAVHSTHIYHLATGYPSNPYLVASTPVSGLTIVIDLLDPSVETTSQTNPAIVPQPDLLQWSDHLQGFVSISPSSRPLNSTIGFFHSRAFSATMRKVLDGDALISCLAVGVQHPFVLVAFLDGTVWACNPMHRVFAPRHYPPAWKLKLFEHEHIPRMRLEASLNPPEDPCRGVSRIVQGWKPVMNKGPQALINLARNTPSARPPKKKSRAIPRLKKTKKKADEEADPRAAGGADNDEDGGLYADPEKIILREPLSRATAMAWNPNMDFACWAAISLASGLVKVMDLGVDYLPEE